MRFQAILFTAGLASLFLQAAGRAIGKDCSEVCSELPDAVGSGCFDNSCHGKSLLLYHFVLGVSQN